MKKFAILTYLFLNTLTVFGHDDSGSSSNIVIQSGVGLGSVIAVVTSWHRNKSVLWAIVHGILSWIYVVYFAITEK